MLCRVEDGLDPRRPARSEAMRIVGRGEARWDGRDERDEQGRPVPDGVYWVRLAFDRGTTTR
ncbi:MAG TPA: hypothetical protein VGK93_07340 [Candidatus Eisenbacteria bacterium]